MQQATKRLLFEIWWNKECLSKKKWILPLGMLLCAGVYEVFSAAIMYTSSNLYVSLSHSDYTLFWKTVFLSFVLITCESVVDSFKVFIRDSCGVNWRKLLVEYCHSMLHTHIKQLNNPILHLPNLDQRLTQDLMKLCDISVIIFEKALILPAVILYYTFYLTQYISLLAPILCILYFACGAIGSYYFMQYIIPLEYLQGKFEGNFRYLHTHLMQYLETIQLIQGGDVEISLVQDKFLQNVLSNQQHLITNQMRLNLCNNWFAYCGTVVSQIIIGITIMSLANNTSSDTTGDVQILLLSRGSYACMSLIHALTQCLELSNQYSLVLGLGLRLEEFLCISNISPSLSPSSNKITSNSNTTYIPPIPLPLPLPLPYKDNDKNNRDRDDALLPLLPLSLPYSIELTPTTNSHSNSNSDCHNTTTNTTTTDTTDNDKVVLFGLHHYYLYTPNHSKLLLSSLSFSFTPGMKLLVTGNTGCGKSTLLKYLLHHVLALQHCHHSSHSSHSSICDSSSDSSSDGIKVSEVLLREYDMYYLPQLPYLIPQGSILENVIYPHTLSTHSDSNNNTNNSSNNNSSNSNSSILSSYLSILPSILTTCQLSYPSQLLHHTNNSDNTNSDNNSNSNSICDTMSTGEQQCLAFARIFYHHQYHHQYHSYHKNKKMLVWLDEASSAMDEETEAKVYNHLYHTIPSYISIGHRSSIRQYHSHELQLHKNGSYTFLTLSDHHNNSSNSNNSV